jgi:hypothetical protein
MFSMLPIVSILMILFILHGHLNKETYKTIVNRIKTVVTVVNV